MGIVLQLKSGRQLWRPRKVGGMADLKFSDAGCQWYVTAETVSHLCQQGQLNQAAEALGVLVQMDSCIAQSLFRAVIKRCETQRDPVVGRRVHALVVMKGYESDTFLCNHIMRMYAAHALLAETMGVFTVAAKPDAFMWSSVISAHVRHGKAEQAIQLYKGMRRSGVKSDGHVFVAALQACARAVDLHAGQQVHADVLASGSDHSLFVYNALVDMYAKCDSLEDAQKVFDGLDQKDVVTWNAIIAGYTKQGMGWEALRLYSALQEEVTISPTCVTFLCLLQACASVGSPGLAIGKHLHSRISEAEYEADVVVANSLVNMYAKCGSLEDAQRVFDGLCNKNVVTWTALLGGYLQQGMAQEALCLYSAMEKEGSTVPDAVTFAALLQACASLGGPALEKGRHLHAQIGEQGLETEVLLGCSLVNMYAKCGSLHDAQMVFDRLGQKNVASWTALIAGYSQRGLGHDALRLYSMMQEGGVAAPDSVTFVCLLQACASVGTSALDKGRQLHAQITEQGHQADDFISNCLVNMYAKCGSLGDAQRVFDGLTQKDVVTWTALLAGYSKQGMGQEALLLYGAMQEEGITVPDCVTFVSLLQACASVGQGALAKGKQLHAEIRERGLQADVILGSSLVNLYSKCGSVEDAQAVFDGLGQRNSVTWTALIAGYSQNGMGQEALHRYNAMQEEGMAVPNALTFVYLLQACACVGAPALDKGKELHAQIRERGFQTDLFVASSLVNMYAKCGSLEDSQGVFDGLSEKNVVTWTALIAGYFQQGMGQEALCLYSAMADDRVVVPDSFTYTCLLQACGNGAALHTGKQLHAQIKEQGLQADVLVARSLINMYGKAGSMFDAQQVFEALPEKDVVTWNALIAGYTRQGDSEVVFDLFCRMRADDVQPSSITFLSVLTVCSHAGLVDRGRDYFEAMRQDFGISPTVEHYTCMVDLLGRAGQLNESLALIRAMPVQANAAVWHTLLNACRKWGNVEVGCRAFDEAVKLDEKDAAAYVLMSSIYTGAQMWDHAQQMQVRRIGSGAWKQPGQSWWTDLDGLAHGFLVGDTKHPEMGGLAKCKAQRDGFHGEEDEESLHLEGTQICHQPDERG